MCTAFPSLYGWWMCIGDECALVMNLRWPMTGLFSACCPMFVGISMISRNPCLGRCLAWGGDGLPPSSCCLCWDVAGEEPDLPDLLSSLRAMNAQALREAWQRWGSWCFCMFLFQFVIYLYLFIVYPSTCIHQSIHPSIHPSIYSIPINRYE